MSERSLFYEILHHGHGRIMVGWVTMMEMMIFPSLAAVTMDTPHPSTTACSLSRGRNLTYRLPKSYNGRERETEQTDRNGFSTFAFGTCLTLSRSLRMLSQNHVCDAFRPLLGYCDFVSLLRSVRDRERRTETEKERERIE